MKSIWTPIELIFFKNGNSHFYILKNGNSHFDKNVVPGTAHLSTGNSSNFAQGTGYRLPEYRVPVKLSCLPILSEGN